MDRDFVGLLIFFFSLVFLVFVFYALENKKTYKNNLISITCELKKDNLGVNKLANCRRKSD